jgi:hypothetical protein
VFSSLFGDPAPGVPKGLAIEYKLGNTGGTVVTDNVVNDCFGVCIDSTGARTLKVGSDVALEITRAYYGDPARIWGSGEGGMDITELVRGQVADNQLRLNESGTPGYVSKLVGADPAPGICKVTAVEFKIGTVAGTIVTEALDGEPTGVIIDMFGARTVSGRGPRSGPVMEVRRAWYGDPARLFIDGGVDMTEFARADLADGEMRMNEACAKGVFAKLFGDPAPGVPKVAAVEFAIDGDVTLLVTEAVAGEPVGFVIDHTGGYALCA